MNEKQKELINQSEKYSSEITRQSLLKIWSYFNGIKNIDKGNLLKNIQSGQEIYIGPVSSYTGGKLVNMPEDRVVCIDRDFMEKNPKIAKFQVTHECMHGVSLMREGKIIVFGHVGHESKGGSKTNKYNGVNEACTQMFAEDAEGKRLPENVDYLYYIKNIMRAMKVLFGEENLANQFLGNNTDFEDKFNQFSEYKFDEFNDSMSNIYLLERKKRDGIINDIEQKLLIQYKSELNKSVSQLIQKKSIENPDIRAKLVEEIQDKNIIAQLDPTQGQGIQKENQVSELNDFVHKFVDSYRRLETKEQYDKRLDREESDIEYVAEYVNEYRKGNTNNMRFLGLQPEVVDKSGKIDFSQDKIDMLFRMLNAANNLTVGNHNYIGVFCQSSEVQDLLKQMHKSSVVQNMINQAENDKKSGKSGTFGYTPAERDVRLARKAFKSLKSMAEMSGRDDNYVFNTIIDEAHINIGYESEEEFSLAKVCCRQRGIKVQSKNIDGKYKLDIISQTQSQEPLDPQKIKQDTIIAGINISEINRYTKDLKDSILNIVKGGKGDKNR